MRDNFKLIYAPLLSFFASSLILVNFLVKGCANTPLPHTEGGLPKHVQTKINFLELIFHLILSSSRAHRADFC